MNSSINQSEQQCGKQQKLVGSQKLMVAESGDNGYEEKID